MSLLQFNLALAVLTAVSLIGCSSSGGVTSAESATTQPPVRPDFERMLSFVPYAFVEEHDIWFGDPEKAKQLHGIEGIDSFVDLMVSDDEQFHSIFSEVLTGIRWLPDLMRSTMSSWNQAFGYDAMMVSRIVFSDVPPPWCFSVMEGGFDTDLIVSRLSEHGYEKRKYESFTYYTIRDDFDLNLQNEATRIAMASMNRVAILDGTIVTAPATDIMNGILDAIAGNEVAMIDDVACRALASSMGEVLSAVIMTPDRLLHIAPGHGEMPSLDFTIPAGWGVMHQYDMVGMGYKDDGKQRSWIISLYYTNGDAAQSDATELAKRMDSYVFTKVVRGMKNLPLTTLFGVGDPTVTQYSDGATLTVQCSLHPETDPSLWIWIALSTRDLLFLTPEPSLLTE